MRFAIVSSTLALLTAANEETPANPQAALLGINCGGSGLCIGKGVASALQKAIQQAPNRVWNNGEHIACVSMPGGGICAFLQGTSHGLSTHAIQELANELLRHGCKVCGSVPIGFPKSNDPSSGILTFNYSDALFHGCGIFTLCRIIQVIGGL
jgi:hypothetical protein